MNVLKDAVCRNLMLALANHETNPYQFLPAYMEVILGLLQFLRTTARFLSFLIIVSRQTRSMYQRDIECYQSYPLFASQASQPPIPSSLDNDSNKILGSVIVFGALAKFHSQFFGFVKVYQRGVFRTIDRPIRPTSASPTAKNVNTSN